MAKQKQDIGINLKDIEEKIKSLDKKIDIEIEKKNSGKTNPTQEFLHKIKEIIKKGINKNIGYKRISDLIFEEFNFEVSTQTLRVFAQTQLGVKKKEKNINIKTLEDNEEKLVITSEQIKEKLKNNTEDEGF